jgi:hypothetical protein
MADVIKTATAIEESGGEPDLSIEEVESAEGLPGAALSLRGSAAVRFIDALGAAAIEPAKTAARPRTVYRLVPCKELRDGLDAGRLRMATPRRGGSVSVYQGKPKGGSLWTVSGGGFESSRRSH